MIRFQNEPKSRKNILFSIFLLICLFFLLFILYVVVLFFKLLRILINFLLRIELIYSMQSIVAKSLTVSDNYFNIFLKESFHFLLFNLSTCNLFSSLIAPIHVLVTKTVTNLSIFCRNCCFLCRIMCVFINVLLIINICVSFCLLLAILRNNTSP